MNIFHIFTLNAICCFAWTSFSFWREVPFEGMWRTATEENKLLPHLIVYKAYLLEWLLLVIRPDISWHAIREMRRMKKRGQTRASSLFSLFVLAYGDQLWMKWQKFARDGVTLERFKNILIPLIWELSCNCQNKLDKTIKQY